MTEKKKWSCAAYLLVPDIKQAAEYYRDKLGFSFDRYWGEPENFVMVERGGVTIMISQVQMAKMYPEMINPNRKSDHHSWDVYIWVEDTSIETLYEEFKAKGANVVKKPTKIEYYGMYELEIQDPFGYVICFGQDLDSIK